MKKVIYGMVLFMSGLASVFLGLMLIGFGIFEPELTPSFVGVFLLVGGGWLTYYGWVYCKRVKIEMEQMRAAQPEVSELAVTEEEKAAARTISRLQVLWCGVVWLAVFIPLRAQGLNPIGAFFIAVAVAFITMPFGVIILAAIGKFIKGVFARSEPEEK